MPTTYRPPTSAIIASSPSVPESVSFAAPGPVCQNTVRDSPSNAVDPSSTTTTAASPGSVGAADAFARGLRSTSRPSSRRPQGDRRAISVEYTSKPSPRANHSSPNHSASARCTAA